MPNNNISTANQIIDLVKHDQKLKNYGRQNFVLEQFFRKSQKITKQNLQSTFYVI